MTNEELYNEVGLQIYAAIEALKAEGIMVLPPTNIKIERL